MLKYLKAETNKTFTENGAVAFKTTNSACLDLFSTIGAMRNSREDSVLNSFYCAYSENPDLAMKILFFARDIRGGLGERKVFRLIINDLAKRGKSSVLKNLRYIAEYGRFDDLLVLLNTDCECEAVELIKAQLETDIKNMNSGNQISLLAKWMPSINASSKSAVANAKKLANALGYTKEKYRKTLSALRAQLKIAENNLRTEDFTFDYEKLPSKALFKYRFVFMRKDRERYEEFINRAESGEGKLNASTLMPYELLEPYIGTLYNSLGRNDLPLSISETEQAALNATWKSLPDFCNGENALAVVDTSGSMYCYNNPSPASVALSLGIYFAEHSKGVFKNHFIEFSKNPQLIEIKGNTFIEKLRYILRFYTVANTDIEKVFELILNTAVKYNVPQSELPSKLYIISDMEFDYCVNNREKTNFENAKQMFEEKGYALPKVVFWNVASRNLHQPVTMNEQGVALVSGCSPRLFSMVTSDDINPYKYMLEVIESERYKNIAA